MVVEDRYRLVRCRECRTEYFRPDLTLAARAKTEPVSEYWEEYKFGLYASEDVRRGYEQRYTATLDQAERLTGPIETVLDIGCGIGNFVSFAQTRYANAYGVDVDPDAVTMARSRGLRVALSEDLDSLLPDATADVVTLWDVIEHLYDPFPVLGLALQKLRPGGTVIFETPDASFPVRPLILAVNAASRGRVDLTGHMYYWEHKIYFTEAGMRAILGRLGCKVVSVQRPTSPRAKMQEIFTRYAGASWPSRAMARAWPRLEGAARRAGRGNKLIVIAHRDPGPADHRRRSAD
ncbi:class I SAM-dependent methyltransferase [Streptomyces guryensis]|uniref:Class I SAM-dependent methyltransferase n=1 Tax=Streptomyces guryensis TaxID=2886947 RepID=A0A9Q3VJM4_9ACTN|nr:class I SAM-dependent methyltransferase [Streptomyces guryensis]MCD9872241.1 class I SAM-dependent methyltransferase [Streptomyces guryensis]